MNSKQEYIHHFIKAKNPQLEVIAQEEKTRNDVCPSIGLDIGNFLYLLIKILQARKVLEFGTCLGYSTIWLAQALETTNGNLTAIEVSSRLAAETAENVRKAGLSHRVEIICGRADELIDKMPGPFDIILQDAAKDIYLPMLDKCVEKLRPGGLLISDDVLFPILKVRKKQQELLEAYNRALFQHPQLESTILPLGDGLAISRKKT
ncbi:O-methyltransferase [Zhaonella formicivorans]|uniref:O-methyltransferase n=1 Tax=Zhaonella formicivorans TaxID=2528593 RepID=UPI001D1028A6|nr:O-methyltransferase [Zhaonella formicivorans]